jgi:hypothetical protein
VVYFFTGSAPVAHPVKNISTNGFYVFTEERWYPDTIIRITFSDQREPSREYSLTVHARVARRDRDGVGLQFVLFEKKAQNRGNSQVEEDPAMVVSKDQVENFVRRFKSRPELG